MCIHTHTEKERHTGTHKRHTDTHTHIFLINFLILWPAQGSAVRTQWKIRDRGCVRNNRILLSIRCARYLTFSHLILKTLERYYYFQNSDLDPAHSWYFKNICWLNEWLLPRRRTQLTRVKYCPKSCSQQAGRAKSPTLYPRLFLWCHAAIFHIAFIRYITHKKDNQWIT